VSAPEGQPGQPAHAHALVVHPAFLGDTVFLGPALRALKARWPAGRTTVVATPRGAPVARLLPGCDEVVVFDKRRADSGLAGLWRVGRQLAALRPDLALVPHPSLRSGLLARFSGAPRRIGYAPFCTERLRLDRSGTFVDRSLRLAAAAGAPGTADLGLAAPPLEGEAAGRLLSGASRPVVGLVPGAEWATKRWGAGHWAALAGMLGGTPLLLGGPADRELAAAIAAASPVPVRDTCGNSIEEAVALLARCDLVVGGDTGLVHCARALGRPTVILFGPTRPERHRFGARERALALGLECQPCHDHGPATCPLGHHRCMVDLSPERVAEAARALLDGLPGRPLRSAQREGPP
jgi:heptosyltransferase-2